VADERLFESLPVAVVDSVVTMRRRDPAQKVVPLERLGQLSFVAQD
jgi:hypothetical protein